MAKIPTAGREGGVKLAHKLRGQRQMGSPGNSFSAAGAAVVSGCLTLKTNLNEILLKIQYEQGNCF